MLGAVLGHHQHAVARAHIQGPQFGLGRVGERAQVGKTQAAAVRQMNEGPRGRLGQPAVQQVMDALCHLNPR